MAVYLSKMVATMIGPTFLLNICETAQNPYHGNRFSVRHFIRKTKNRPDNVRRINNTYKRKHSHSLT